VSDGELIRRLERIDIYNHVLVEFLLVWAKAKPATTWHTATSFYTEGLPTDHRTHPQFDELVAWTKAAGLAYELHDEHIDDKGRTFDRKTGKPTGEIYSARYRIAGEPLKTAEDRLTLLAAQDAKWLTKLVEADRTGDDKLLGTCFGFAPTAIQAYVAGTCVPPNQPEIPLETRAFAHFMVSPGHWQDEVGVAARWSQVVKELSPQLYEASLDYERRRRRS
jgi:hypothetical protein